MYAFILICFFFFIKNYLLFVFRVIVITSFLFPYFYLIPYAIGHLLCCNVLTRIKLAASARGMDTIFSMMDGTKLDLSGINVGDFDTKARKDILSRLNSAISQVQNFTVDK